MMRAVVTFYDNARKAIVESSGDTKLTMATISTEMKDLLIRLTKLKFEVIFRKYFVYVNRVQDKLNKKWDSSLVNSVKKLSRLSDISLRSKIKSRIYLKYILLNYTKRVIPLSI